MKIIRIAIFVLFACGLPACDTDRYANQPTITVTDVDDPGLRKALIKQLNAVNFDYEITRQGDIRFPRKNQPEFDAILAQIAQEQDTRK